MEPLSRHWWVFLLRGLFALAFGVAVLAWPAASLATIVMVFGIYVLTDGLFALAYALTPSAPHRIALVLEGVIGIVVGFLALRAPTLTLFALYGYVAFWAILTGIGEVVLAVRMREVIDNELFLFLGGVSSIVLGVLMLTLPQAGMLALVWLVGIYSLLAAALLLLFAVRLRSFGRPASTPPPTEPAMQR
ncbi:MAG: HdeD family acid-resistance protein [Polyangia bacterium]|jgi:uncharacterized membrane protein HdeD (DUF308 family)